MAAVKLYLDADVTAALSLATMLRQRGFDVVSAVEVGSDDWGDAEQLAYAIEQGRALLTFNVKDFVPLVDLLYKRGQDFPGLIVSPQIKGAQFSLLLRLILNLLNRADDASMRNTIRFLQEFR